MKFVVTDCLLFVDSPEPTRLPRKRKSGMADLRDSSLLELPADMEQVRGKLDIRYSLVRRQLTLLLANGKITDLFVAISTLKAARPQASGVTITYWLHGKDRKVTKSLTISDRVRKTLS